MVSISPSILCFHLMQRTDLSIQAFDRGGQTGDDGGGVGGVGTSRKAGALERCSKDARKGAGQSQDGDECGTDVDSRGFVNGMVRLKSRGYCWRYL